MANIIFQSVMIGLWTFCGWIAIRISQRARTTEKELRAMIVGKILENPKAVQPSMMATLASGEALGKMHQLGKFPWFAIVVSIAFIFTGALQLFGGE